jgi:hypothetical protein
MAWQRLREATLASTQALYTPCCMLQLRRCPGVPAQVQQASAECLARVPCHVHMDGVVFGVTATSCSLTRCAATDTVPRGV